MNFLPNVAKIKVEQTEAFENQYASYFAFTMKNISFTGPLPSYKRTKQHPIKIVEKNNNPIYIKDVQNIKKHMSARLNEMQDIMYKQDGDVKKFRYASTTAILHTIGDFYMDNFNRGKILAMIDTIQTSTDQSTQDRLNLLVAALKDHLAFTDSIDIDPTLNFSKISDDEFDTIITGCKTEYEIINSSSQTRVIEQGLKNLKHRILEGLTKLPLTDGKREFLQKVSSFVLKKEREINSSEFDKFVGEFSSSSTIKLIPLGTLMAVQKLLKESGVVTPSLLTPEQAVKIVKGKFSRELMGMLKLQIKNIHKGRPDIALHDKAIKLIYQLQVYYESMKKQKPDVLTSSAYVIAKILLTFSLFYYQISTIPLAFFYNVTGTDVNYLGPSFMLFSAYKFTSLIPDILSGKTNSNGVILPSVIIALAGLGAYTYADTAENMAKVILSVPSFASLAFSFMLADTLVSNIHNGITIVRDWDFGKTSEWDCVATVSALMWTSISMIPVQFRNIQSSAQFRNTLKVFNTSTEEWLQEVKLTQNALGYMLVGHLIFTEFRGWFREKFANFSHPYESAWLRRIGTIFLSLGTRDGFTAILQQLNMSTGFGELMKDFSDYIGLQNMVGKYLYELVTTNTEPLLATWFQTLLQLMAAYYVPQLVPFNYQPATVAALSYLKLHEMSLLGNFTPTNPAEVFVFNVIPFFSDTTPLFSLAYQALYNDNLQMAAAYSAMHSVLRLSKHSRLAASVCVAAYCAMALSNPVLNNMQSSNALALPNSYFLAPKFKYDIQNSSSITTLYTEGRNVVDYYNSAKNISLDMYNMMTVDGHTSTILYDLASNTTGNVANVIKDIWRDALSTTGKEVTLSTRVNELWSNIINQQDLNNYNEQPIVKISELDTFNKSITGVFPIWPYCNFPRDIAHSQALSIYLNSVMLIQPVQESMSVSPFFGMAQFDAPIISFSPINRPPNIFDPSTDYDFPLGVQFAQMLHKIGTRVEDQNPIVCNSVSTLAKMSCFDVWDGDRSKPVFENWVLTLHAVEILKVLHRDRNQANVYGYETFTRVHLQILNYYSNILDGPTIVKNFEESRENNALLACMMISNPITMNNMQFNTFVQFKTAFEKGFKKTDSRKKQALLALGIPDTQRYVSNALLGNIKANFVLATYTGSDMNVKTLTDMIDFINQHNITNTTTGLRLPDNPAIATNEQLQTIVENPPVIPETNYFSWPSLTLIESQNTDVEKSAAVSTITSGFSDIAIDNLLKNTEGKYKIIALGENEKDTPVSTIILKLQHHLASNIDYLLLSDPVYQKYTTSQKILEINLQIANIAKRSGEYKINKRGNFVYKYQNMRIELAPPTPAVLLQEEGGLSFLNELILRLFHNDAFKKNNEIAKDEQQENDWASSIMNKLFGVAGVALAIKTGLAGTIFGMFKTRIGGGDNNDVNVKKNSDDTAYDIIDDFDDDDITGNNKKYNNDDDDDDDDDDDVTRKSEEEQKRMVVEFDSTFAQVGIAPVLINPFPELNTKTQEQTAPLYNFQTKQALFVETLKKRQMVCWLKVRAAYEISQLSKAYQKKMFDIVRGIPNLLDPISKAIIFCNDDPNMRLVLSSVFSKGSKVNKIFKNALDNKDKVPDAIDAMWLQNFTDPEYVFAWGRNNVFVPMTGEDALELPPGGMKTPDGILLTNANFEHYRLLVFLIQEFTVMSIKGDTNDKIIKSRTSRAVRQNKL